MKMVNVSAEKMIQVFVHLANGKRKTPTPKSQVQNLPCVINSFRASHNGLYPALIGGR